MHIPRNLKTWISVGLLLLVLISTSISVWFSHPAMASGSTKISGTVNCYASSGTAIDSVVGVWAVANNGGSGWASWQPWGKGVLSNGANFQFTLPNGGYYGLHVGCGGTAQKWASTSTTIGIYNGSGYTFDCLAYSKAYDAYKCIAS